ncbi:hypothetical protein BKA81DRAFT_7678 [Phyllosticta paracitricarpa]
MFQKILEYKTVGRVLAFATQVHDFLGAPCLKRGRSGGEPKLYARGSSDVVPCGGAMKVYNSIDQPLASTTIKANSHTPPDSLPATNHTNPSKTQTTSPHPPNLDPNTTVLARRD